MIAKGLRMPGRRQVRRLLLLALAAVVAVHAAPAQSAGRSASDELAVVVSPGVSVGALSLRDLQSIYRGEQQFWGKGGRRITLLLPAPGTAEREAVLRHVFGMSESEYMRFWIAKTFRDEVTSGPKVVGSSVLTIRLVRSLPGAIAFVRLSELDDRGVRVMRIDGALPRDDGYPLPPVANRSDRP